jgi:hypothetical protein
LDAFERRSHAAGVRRFGTDLTTVRFDFDKQRSRAVLALNEPVVYGAGRIITMRPFEPVRRS